MLASGVLLGWLRVSDQPHSAARAGVDADRPFLSSHLCGVLHSLLPGHRPLHADLFCWIPGEELNISFEELLSL